MIQVSVEVKGYKELERSTRRLNLNIPKYMDKATIELGRYVQKSAKLRAPRWTGALARSIFYERVSARTVIIGADSPYGLYQERGFKPHYVSIHTSSWNPENYTLTPEAWLRDKGYRAGSRGHIFVTRWKVGGFMSPALNAGITRLNKIYSKEIDKSIIKSK